MTGKPIRERQNREGRVFSRILVGTDGSETASVAAANASALAEAMGAELLIATAYRAPRAEGPPVLRGEEYASPEVARSILKNEQARLRGVQARALLREGHPADVLLELAEEEDVDLIVVGNKGMSGAKRFVIGSVPNNVSHHAPCHVLIVHTTWAMREPAADRDERPVFKTLLLATDGSETAQRAVGVGVDLAATLGAEVVLLFVGDKRKGEEVLRQAAEAVGGRVGVQTESVEGDPAERIVEVASSRNVDVIVVGNKGMRGARRLLGSVPNSVSHHADRTVLIVKTV